MARYHGMFGFTTARLLSTISLNTRPIFLLERIIRQTQSFMPLPHSLVRHSQRMSKEYMLTRFKGSAVYVICVLPNSGSNMDYLFFIDGNQVGTFTRAVPGTSDYVYNVAVYSNTGLTNGAHTIIMQTGHIGGQASVMLIDRIIYTYVCYQSTVCCAFP